MDEQIIQPYFLQRLKKVSHEAFTLRMVGFMLAKTWVFAFFFFSGDIFGATPLGSLFSFDALSRYALILTLMIFGVRAGTWVTPKSLGLNCALAAAFSIVGTLCVAVPSGGTAALVLLAAGALLTGMGSGMLSIMWGIDYSATTGSVTAAEVSLAYACATFILPAYVLLPQVARVALLVLMPALSALLLLDQQRREVPSRQAGGSAAALEDVRASRITLTKISVSSVVFGLVIVLLRCVYEQALPESAGHSALLLASSSLAAALIVIGVLVFSRNPGFAFSYQPVLLLVAVGCFLLPMVERGTVLPYFFARCGYVCFQVLNFVLLSGLASRSRMKPGTIFGIGLASSSFGMFVGQSIFVLGNQAGAALLADTSALSGLLVFVLLITYVFTMTNRADAGARVPKVSKSQSGQDASELSEATEGQTARFRERCQRLADDAGISERACEVMVLYAKGRSKSRIEQELYISQSTVSFHLRNIYQKLGIHSRQELIDAIEAVDLMGEE